MLDSNHRFPSFSRRGTGYPPAILPCAWNWLVLEAEKVSVNLIPNLTTVEIITL